MKNINVLIAGATGYIGIELVKLLSKHKYVKIKYLCGNLSVGKKISYYDKYFKNSNLPKIVKFKKSLTNNIDVIFSALPNGDAQKISNVISKKITLIDLSGDFRLKNAKEYFKWYKKIHQSEKNIKNSIYSLPELDNNNYKKYNIISCPGCYPTSILLPLVPILKENLIKNNNIIIDSKSGYSGAGRSVHKKFKNKNLYQSLSVYGVSNHKHNSEIQEQLNKHIKKKVNYNFTPHLIPMFRGIFTSIYVELSDKSSTLKVINCLKKYYKKSFFVKIRKQNELLSTNSVINSNKCYISVCKLKDKKKLLILSVIDNLIKGGSGQAVQNFNKLYNFKEYESLK